MILVIMTKTTIFVFIALTSILLLGISIVQASTHDDASSPGPVPIPYPNIAKTDTKAIPSWIQFTMQAYLNGEISERELLDAFKFLLDRGILHMSQTAAQQMADLREENKELKKKLSTDGIVGPDTWSAGDSTPPGSQISPSQTPVIVMPASTAAMCTGERSVPFIPGGQVVQGEISNVQVLVSPPGQSLGRGDPFAGDYYVSGSTHTYTNENGNRFLMVPVPEVFGGSDEKSSCWVRVSQTHAGDPDRPIVTGRVYNFGEEIYPDEYGSTSSSGDMPLKGSKIKENAPAEIKEWDISGSGDDRPTEEVAFYFNKIASASETVHDLVSNGETSTTGWEEGVAEFTNKNYGSESTASGNKPADTLIVQDLLNGFIVAIEKEILVIEGEVVILEELMGMYTSTSTRTTTQYDETDFNFISRHTAKIDNKIQSLQTGLGVVGDMLPTSGDSIMDNLSDDLRANIVLQEAIHKNLDDLKSLELELGLLAKKISSSVGKG